MSVTILGQLAAGGEQLPLYSLQALVGHSSPVAAHAEKHICLADVFNVRTPHVHLVKIDDDSMEGAGIYRGDLVTVDRSLYAEHGDIVIAALNSDPICKRLHMRNNVFILQSENPEYPPRYVMEDDDLVIWGVVKHSVRSHHTG
ncbi:putative prophage repressor [Paucimonas lemoignei]|jgi:DNA polymerase V|nr:putative prophage repressor [Paucimonas lemoignei]